MIVVAVLVGVSLFYFFFPALYFYAQLPICLRRSLSAFVCKRERASNDSCGDS